MHARRRTPGGSCRTSTIALAALGDHEWRKYAGVADDAELARTPSWQAGRSVAIPELIRPTGRGGARGRHPAARDLSMAIDVATARRTRRAAEHTAALAELAGAPYGAPLSERAARVDLRALMAAARRPARLEARSAAVDGIAVTIVAGDGSAALVAPTWRVLLPARIAVIHLPDRPALLSAGAGADPGGGPVEVHVEGVARAAGTSPPTPTPLIWPTSPSGRRR